MEQQENYVNGFNVGYRLRKFSPSLFDKLKGALSQEVDYERGVLEGGKELEREAEKTNGRLEELSDIRQKSDRDKQIERE